MLSALFSPKDTHESYIFETSPEIILFLDLRGRIVQINNRVHDWLGIKPQKLLGKSVFDLNILTPESKEIVKQNFTKRISGKKVKPYDIECFAHDGHIEHGRVTATLIKKGAIPTGILVMISNVTQLETELKVKLEEVRTSEIRYKGLFDNINHAAVICDYDKDKKAFYIKEVNTAFRRIEKCNKKDIIGKKLHHIFPHVSQSDICEIITNAWQKDTSANFEVTIKKQGKEQFRKGTVYRLPTDELVVLYEDITKSVRAEKNVKESEKKYRALFETANDAIFIMDGKSFIDCNDKTIEIFGCTKKSDLIDKTPLDFSPSHQPDGQTSKRKALKYIRLAMHGRPQRFYWQHIKKNGQVFDAEVTLNKVTLSKGDLIQAIVRDVTAERATLTKLSESEQKFRTIIENAQAIIFIIDENGEFILSEGKKLTALGLKSKQVVGQNIRQLYKDYPQVISGVESALKGKTIRKTIFINNIYFDTFFSPHYGEKDKIIGVIGMAIDVTASELAKTRLLEMDQAKSEFISMASHQLRSPLSTIRWELESVLQATKNLLPDTTTASLQRVYQQNLRLISLVNKLLNISRIENQKDMEKPAKVDLVALTQKILKERKEKIAESQLEVYVNAPRSLTIYHDPNILYEVLVNLVNNAIKFNKQHGTIIIELEKKEKDWCLCIANTGQKIAKKDHEHIFEKFYRGTNTSDAIGGTGLGLYIVKAYIRKWSGEISFESPTHFGEKTIRGTKNSGTIFTITVPCAEAK